jgi:CheY-like chemotaxis protein
LLIEENRAHIVQVGDSRAYILRNGKIYRLTKDQSMVQTLIDSGIIQPEDAETHPYRHVILQSLGAEPTVYPVTSTIDLYNGDCLLLCSDGLSNMVKDDMLESIVLQASDLGMCSRLLLESANDLGGNDNITLILADLTYTTVVEEEDAVQVGVPPYPQIIQSTVTGKLTTLTEMQGEEAENYPTPPEEAALPDNALVAAVEDGCLERLLIIDSSPETFNGIEAILKPYYHLITAADGEEGLAKAITEHPRLIIASAELEKIPAINLCYTLKSSERFRHIPLILVSNIYREKMHLIQALSNGADEYLVTPFDRVEVLLRVKSHIEQSRLLKKLRYDSALHEANNIQLQNEMETIAKTRQDIFQNVLDAVSDGMLITDKAGWVTAVNRTFVDFHRISGENIVGFGYRALLRKIQRFYDNPEIQVQRFTDLLNHPETTADDEVKVRHERRGMVAIKRYSAPVRDEDGNIYGRLFIFRNLIS